MRAPAIALAVLFGSSLAAGQTPTPKPQGTPAPAVQPQPPQAESYSYNPDGRRDPFVTLLGTGAEPRATRRGEGVVSLTVNEISVSGVMQSKGGLIAMVQGPDKKTYIVHQGDHLADGTIKTITTQGLIIIQEVNDPLSLVKQREVRKLLRSLEDAK